MLVPYGFILRGLDDRGASRNPANMSHLDNDSSVEKHPILHYRNSKWKKNDFFCFEFRFLSYQVSRDIVSLFTFCSFDIPQAHPVISRARAQLCPICIQVLDIKKQD